MKYSAFISYNHRDRRWATWLHRELERYRLPKRLQGRDTPVGPVQDRLPPVFRDRDELAASSDLADAVKQALAESATLIVICSSNAAGSRWVNEEIRTFAALGRRARILCLVVAGEPHASDPAAEAFPPALFEVLDGDPLAADLRKGQDGRTGAKLKLIASMLDLPYDELRQRELVRRQRRLALVASGSAIGFLVMTALAVVALLSRNEAVQQRDLARQRTITAERTVEFVQSMFEVADPSQARGETITAREVLDRGARLIEQDLDDEPAVKAELGLTLGQVYGALGLYRQSDRLIRHTFGLKHDQAQIRARQLAALGASQLRLGAYEQASGSLKAAAAAARQSGEDGARLLPTILVDLGQAQSGLGESKAADRSIRQALAADLARFGESHPDVARDLEALGLNHYYDGDFAEARPLFERALRINLRIEGRNSPSVSDNLLNLGNIAYRNGDNRAAERFFRSRLAVDEQVLGANHPDVATTLNSVARVLIERRAFQEALGLLVRAAAISMPEKGEMHADMAYMLANLSLARRGVGEAAEAEALMSKAMLAAKANDHPALAPNMTDLAELKCRRGAVGEGLALLSAARPIMARDYPDDPWRAAWVDNVSGACLLDRQPGEAARLLRTSADVLAARWPPSSFYGFESRRRLRLAQARRLV